MPREKLGAGGPAGAESGFEVVFMVLKVIWKRIDNNETGQAGQKVKY